VINLLLVGADPILLEEVEAALEAQDEPRPVIHHVAEGRQGIEAARNRPPELALVEMGTDLEALKTFAREMSLLVPETTVVAVFRPDILGAEVSESQILIEAIRAGVKDFLRRPVSSAELDELLERAVRHQATAAGPVGKVIAVLSNKGGVGKSTVAVNAACGLAQRLPERVLLVDASLQMGVCASTLDLRPATSLVDAVREQHRLDETLIRQLATPHPCGLHVLAAPPDALEAAEVDEDVMSHVLTLARRAYDFVLVDSSPLLDRVMVALLDLSDRAYLVFENVVPTLLGAVKLLEVLHGLGFPPERQRIVINRYAKLRGNLKPHEVAERLGRDVDYVLPYEKGVVVAANTGEPYVLKAGLFSAYGRQIRRLIGDIAAMQQGGSPSRNGRPRQALVEAEPANEETV